MPTPERSEMPQEGQWRRYMFASCERALQAGRTESRFILNDRRLTEVEMRALVEYARRYGFLK